MAWSDQLSAEYGANFSHVAPFANCKAQVHAVLATCGVVVPMGDLFGVGGTELLNGLDLPTPYAA